MVNYKIVKIEPLKVLHRSFISGRDYAEYTITKLTCKQKTSPDLYDSEGVNHYVFHNEGVYVDTPENRAILNDLKRLEEEHLTLSRRIQELIQKAEKVDIRKLHERTLGEDS